MLVDTREQRPLLLPEGSDQAEVEVAGVQLRARRATLRTGDYRLEGAGAALLVERKHSADELAAAVGRDRDRFGRELDRLRAESRRAVLLIEASLDDVRLALGRSRVAPSAVVGSLAGWILDHGVAPIFAGDRRGAEAVLVRLLLALDRRLDGRESGALLPVPSPLPPGDLVNWRSVPWIVRGERIGRVWRPRWVQPVPGKPGRRVGRYDQAEEHLLIRPGHPPTWVRREQLEAIERAPLVVPDLDARVCPDCGAAPTWVAQQDRGDRLACLACRRHWVARLHRDAELCERCDASVIDAGGDLCAPCVEALADAEQ